MNRKVAAACVFHTTQHQDLGADCGHLQHFFEGDLVQLAGVRNDARVGSVDAVHVGIDLADICVKSDGKGDGGGVRATAPQSGDVLGVLGHTLETSDEDDLAFREGSFNAPRGDVNDACVSMLSSGDNTSLRTGHRNGLRTQRGNSHSHQRVGHAFTSGEEHIHFALRGSWVDRRC